MKQNNASRDLSHIAGQGKAKVSFVLFIFFLILAISAMAQSDSTGADFTVNYNKAATYTIANIKVSGTENDKSILIALSGLHQGEKIKIPGEEIPKAIKNLWKQKLFTNISINVEKTVGDDVFLSINVEERPRLLHYSIKGVKNSDGDDLKKKIDLRTGEVLTENKKKKAVEVIKKLLQGERLPECTGAIIRESGYGHYHPKAKTK